MKKNFKIIASSILALLGIILILTPYQLFPVCGIPAPDGTPMKCAYSAKLIIALGVIILLVNLVAILKRKKALYSLAYIATAIAAFFSYALPKQLIKVGNKKTMGWEIGLCAKADHGCRLHTLPALDVIIPAVIIIAVIAIVLNFLIKDKFETKGIKK